MRHQAYSITDGKFGKRLSLHSEWNSSLLENVEALSIRELWLDSSEGWRGDELTFLYSLPKIQSISILARTIENIDPLYNLTELQNMVLMVRHKNVLDLSRFPELYRCYIECGGAYTGFDECFQLKWLQVNEPDWKDFELLAGTPRLETLIVGSAPLLDISQIVTLPQLKEIGLYYCKRLRDYSPISNCRNLQKLDLAGAPLGDLDWLSDAKSPIKRVDLTDVGRIKSLAPLLSLPCLEVLYLMGSTNVEDGRIWQLTQLPNFRKLRGDNRRHYDARWQDFEAPGEKDPERPPRKAVPLGEKPPKATTQPMSEDVFWKLLEETAGAGPYDPAAHHERLRTRLGKLSKTKIANFHAQFLRVCKELNTWDIWAAAYIIGGGCSDDMFADFRSALVARGRSVVEALKSNPDTLADMVGPDEFEARFYEGFQYAAQEAFEDVTDGEALYDYADEKAIEMPPLHDDPSGEPWEEDDPESLRHRCPKLFDKSWNDSQNKR